MQSPEVVTAIEDSNTGVIYEAVAYCNLTPDQARRAILMATTSKQRKKLKRGQTLRLMTVLDHEQLGLLQGIRPLWE